MERSYPELNDDNPFVGILLPLVDWWEYVESESAYVSGTHISSIGNSYTSHILFLTSHPPVLHAILFRHRFLSISFHQFPCEYCTKEQSAEIYTAIVHDLQLPLFRININSPKDFLSVLSSSPVSQATATTNLRTE